MTPAADTAPPHALEAEQALLGGLMFENTALASVAGILDAEHFYEPLHRDLYSLIRDRVAEGRLAEPTTLMASLQAHPAFAPMGGLRYLAELVDRCPPPSNAPEYARLIVEAAVRREAIAIADETRAMARDPGEDPFAALSATSRRLDALMSSAAPDNGRAVDARTSMERTVARLKEEAANPAPRGVLCGIRCFDRRLGGLQPAKLIVVAGRPSMGKSGLCRSVAWGAARRNPERDFLYYSLEMDREELDHRSLAQLSFEAGHGVAHQHLTSTDQRERPGLDALSRFDALTHHAPANLIMDDTPAVGLDYIRRHVLGHNRTRKVAGVFIDYLQIMRIPQVRDRSHTLIIGDITAGLKQLAREAQCAVVLLSQLSRRVEERDNRRPMLSDLRDSGSIEQDADAVLFCYREHYYLQREGPRRNVSDAEHAMALHDAENVMEVICAKRRGGPIGTDKQRYLAAYDVVQDEGDW